MDKLISLFGEFSSAHLMKMYFYILTWCNCHLNLIIFSFSFFSTLTDCSVSWYGPNILYKYTFNLHRYYFRSDLRIYTHYQNRSFKRILLFFLQFPLRRLSEPTSSWCQDIQGSSRGREHTWDAVFLMCTGLTGPTCGSGALRSSHRLGGN